MKDQLLHNTQREQAARMEAAALQEQLLTAMQDNGVLRAKALTAQAEVNSLTQQLRSPITLSASPMDKP